MSIQEIILCIMAVIAVCTFVFSVYKNRRDKSHEELRTWQSVALHSFFESRGKAGATLSESLQWYRTEAMASVPGVQKSELSEHACRRIILSLLKSGVLAQTTDARYRVGVIDTARDMMSEAARDSISKVARDMMSEVMEPMMKSMVPMLDDKRLVREIYSAVAEAPFQKTSDKLAISISDKTGDPVGEICTVLAQEIARQQLKQDEKGRVGFGSMPVEEY